MLNPKNLQVFVAVADLGSISALAAQSGLAQSAISRQIVELERHFAGPLFYRTGRGVVPTELAQAVLPRIRALLAEMDSLEADARARSGNPAGVVNIGLVPAVSAQLASALYGRIRQAFPDIGLRIFEGYSGQIEEWLASGKVEVAVFNLYRDSRQHAYDRLQSTNVLLVAAAGRLPPVNRDAIAFEALAGLPLVLPSLPNTLRTLLEAHAQKRGFALRIEVEANSAGTIKELVGGHALFTTMPFHAVAGELASGRFQAARITGPVMSQELVLATGTHRPLTIAARQVAKILPELVKEFVPNGRPRSRGRT